MAKNLYERFFDEPIWDAAPGSSTGIAEHYAAPGSSEADLTPHEWSLEFSKWGQAACWYKAAENLDTCGEVLALPVWAWRRPKIQMPKTKRGYLFPLKIMWGTPIVTPFDGPTAATWSIDALGNSEEGIAEIGADGAVSGTDSFSPALITTRADLLEKGELAYWELYERICRWTRARTKDALNKIYAEIPGIKISSTDLEIAATEIETGPRNPMKKILGQICDPANPGFTGADPLRVISTEIRRTALEVMRLQLGDTQKGWKIRRVAKELGTENIGEIYEELKNRYPSDNTGPAAIRKALDFAVSSSEQINAVEREVYLG